MNKNSDIRTTISWLLLTWVISFGAPFLFVLLQGFHFIELSDCVMINLIISSGVLSIVCAYGIGKLLINLNQQEV